MKSGGEYTEEPFNIYDSFKDARWMGKLQGEGRETNDVEDNIIREELLLSVNE